MNKILSRFSAILVATVLLSWLTAIAPPRVRAGDRLCTPITYTTSSVHRRQYVVGRSRVGGSGTFVATVALNRSGVHIGDVPAGTRVRGTGSVMVCRSYAGTTWTMIETDRGYIDELSIR